jgi:uncharacterized RDD family membrane protein YckC
MCYENRTSSFAIDSAGRRQLITPEGVDLRINLGSASQRASAFLIDASFIIGIMIGLTLLCVLAQFAMEAAAKALDANWTGGAAIAQFVIVLWLLGFFLLRNGWFLVFELGARAATPGKRIVGLQVAMRNGGRLSADAVIARNAMREIEVFLPLTFLLYNAGANADGWIVLLGLLWSGIFALFPLFNRDRLRVGDLVAGTFVVRAPRRRLATELTQRRSVLSPVFAFTPDQLDVYGVKELQVLEDVLRRNALAAQRVVAERIRGKIGWTPRPGDSDGDFLDAYYAALRTRLEAKLLLGKRRRDKHDNA